MIESKNSKLTIKGTGEEIAEDIYRIACAVLESGMPPLMLTLITYNAIRESDMEDTLDSQIEEVAESRKNGDNLYHDLMEMFEEDGETDGKRS